jgi:hypothetical protein
MRELGQDVKCGYCDISWWSRVVDAGACRKIKFSQKIRLRVRGVAHVIFFLDAVVLSSSIRLFVPRLSFLG